MKTMVWGARVSFEAESEADALLLKQLDQAISDGGAISTNDPRARMFWFDGLYFIEAAPFVPQPGNREVVSTGAAVA